MFFHLRLSNRLDDLLVGAPLYTVKKDGRIIADAGRVDVFYQNRQVGFLFRLFDCSIIENFSSIILYESSRLKEHEKEDDWDMH